MKIKLENKAIEPQILSNKLEPGVYKPVSSECAEPHELKWFVIIPHQVNHSNSYVEVNRDGDFRVFDIGRSHNTKYVKVADLDDLAIVKV